MPDKETQPTQSEPSIQSENEKGPGGHQVTRLPIICGVLFTIVGIVCWIFTLSGVVAHFGMNSQDAYSITVLAVVTFSIGVSCLLVASFGADASLEFGGKVFGDTVVRLGSFFAILALVSVSLFLVMDKVQDRRNEIRTIKQENKEIRSELAELKAYQKAHVPYQHFMEWLATGTKENMGIRVAASLAKHIDDGVAPQPIPISFRPPNEPTSWMHSDLDGNGEMNGNHRQMEENGNKLIGLRKGSVVLELKDEADSRRKFGTMQASLKRDLQLNVGFVFNEQILCSEAFAGRKAIVRNLDDALQHLHQRRITQARVKMQMAKELASDRSVGTPVEFKTAPGSFDEDK